MDQKKLRNITAGSFNKTWELIDKKDRTKEDELKMITQAHKFLHYWKLGGGTELNVTRGEWMLSHMFSILGMGEPALYHAQRCFDMTMKHKYGDFDLVFANEAMAYAHKVLENEELKKEYLEKGYTFIDGCAKQGIISQIGAIFNQKI